MAPRRCVTLIIRELIIRNLLSLFALTRLKFRTEHVFYFQVYMLFWD